MLRKLKLKECILLMGDKLSVITGATGHVGYALVKELEARGENFRILIRKDSKIFDGINCERVFGDVTDPASLEKAFEGADVVYHLAGVIEINKGNEDMTWKVNVDGTKNVVEACKKCGVKRLVYASSVDAYPPLPDNQVMREISHFNPEILDGTYAKTKATATNYVFENNDDKLETVVCYPGACCGPYDFKVSSVGEMVRMFFNGKFPVSLAFGAYNFVDVRDVAKGMIGAAERADPAKAISSPTRSSPLTSLYICSQISAAQRLPASSFLSALQRRSLLSWRSITTPQRRLRSSPATPSAS